MYNGGTNLNALIPYKTLINSGNNNIPFPENAACFNQGTKILCTHGYIPIEQIVPGMLVETYVHGPVAVKELVHGTLLNNPDVPMNCMYQCGDLIVTGGHHVLVDHDTDHGVIDGKKMLLASESDMFEKVINNDIYNYYHLVLCGEPDRQYGIWAESVLCESLSETYALAKKYL